MVNAAEGVHDTPQHDAPAGLWKVGELARRSGITRQAVHQYVTMGLLPPTEFTKGGQRLFDQAALERVKLIRNLCANGYTLQDIREIFLRERAK